MGHPIHKHMSSGQRYDNKQAYNKDLSDSARLHYLENEEKDKNGSPAHMEGGRKDHKMSNSEYSAHLQSPKGKKEHGAGMSRYGSDYSDSPAELTAGGKKKIMASDANPAFKKAIANSPIDNVSYGDKSGKTGYIGGMSRYESVKKERKDLNTINPVDDKAGMSRYKSDAQRKAVHASEADKGMSRAKYGGNKGDKSMSKRDY